MSIRFKSLFAAIVLISFAQIAFPPAVHAQRMMMRPGGMSMSPSPMMPMPTMSMPHPTTPPKTTKPPTTPPTTTPPTTPTTPMSPNNPGNVPTTWVSPNGSAAMMWGSYGGGGYGGGYSGSYSPGDYTSVLMQNANSNSYSRDKRASYSYSPSNSSGLPDGERRRRAEQELLDRSLNSALAIEIVSGKPLNVILADINKSADELGWSSLPDMKLELNDDTWAHINVTAGQGSIAILKNGIRLTWPTALNGAELEEQRRQFESFTAQAILEARSQGTVNATVTGPMSDLVADLQRQLRRKTPGLTFDLHVEAKSFLQSLDDAVTTLRRSDVGMYAAENYSPKATTVPELVKWMTDRGLQFARAIPGDEPAYSALYQRLAAYDRSLREFAKNQ